MLILIKLILLEYIYVIMLFLKAGFYNYSKWKVKAENFGKGKTTRTAVNLNFLCLFTTNKQNEMDLLLRDITMLSF